MRGRTKQLKTGERAEKDAEGSRSPFDLPASCVRVLLALDEEMEVKGLASRTGLPTSTTYRAVSRLETDGLVEYSREGRPRRSFKGTFFVRRLEGMKSSLSFIEENQDFFERLEVELPGGFVGRLEELSNGSVVRPEDPDPFAAIYEVQKLMTGSRWCRCISPVIVEPYVDMTMDYLEMGGRFELVTSRTVVNMVKGRYGSDLTDPVHGNLDVTVVDDTPGMLLLVSENGVALTFRGRDGNFPLNKILIAEDQDAARFGRDLYSYLKESLVDSDLWEV